MICSTLFSICIILLSDSLINRLNLDAKWPKLAKILKVRARLNKAYLRFYIVMLIILILINLGVNIYMFIIAF